MTDLLPKLLLGFALLLSGFAFGVVSEKQRTFPYPIIATALATWSDLRQNWRNDLQIEPTRLLARARHEGAGVTIRKPAQMQPGLTFLASFFDGQVEARLVREDGSVVQRWPIRYGEIWPDRDRSKKGEPRTDWNAFVHGSLALPDGSVVVDFDTGRSLVKLDRCGAVVWKLKQNIHHSVFHAEDGTFWVPLWDDVAQISPEGELMRRISIPQLVKKNDLHGILFFQSPSLPSDRHTNDVELLSTEMAAAFPLFEAGDVLLSMRNLNLVMVFDPDTEVIKWYQHGPWLRQHDPDFLPDGTISIFNNRTDFGSSNIMIIDPVTRQVEIAYEGTRARPFYTAIRGKHQYLANGNLLITSSQAGRVFEVTPAGEIVWEYVNRYDRDRVAIVSNAIRYDPTYFDVDAWSRCDP